MKYRIGLFILTTCLIYHYSFGQSFKPPSANGGFGAFANRMASHMQYPQHAFNNDKDGPVYISILIDPQGNHFWDTVWSAPHHTLADEALRMIDMETSWIPGSIDGQKDTSQINFIYLYRMNTIIYDYDKMFFQKLNRNLYPLVTNYTWTWSQFKNDSKSVQAFTSSDFDKEIIKGDELMLSGDLKNALKTYKSLYPRDPQNQVVLTKISLCYEKLGNTKKACTFIQRAINAGNNSLNSKYNKLCNEN